MLEAIGAVIFGIFYNLTFIILIVAIIFGIKYRIRFFTVHEFSNENVKLPEVVNRIGNEITIKYACSFTKNNQFYLTTSRIIFHCENIFKSKYFTRYFETKSVRNVEISYKNPYIWLIIAGLQVVLGIILAVISTPKSSENNGFFYKEKSNSGAGTAFLIIFLFLIQSGIFVLLWYYLKGYYLEFNNGIRTGLFCRSREGLEDTLKRFDVLRFTNKTIAIPDTKNKTPESLDVICSSCKSVISLDADDLKSSTFVCPICSTVNPTK